MFSRHELETIWQTAKRVRSEYPSTYENLMGVERLAIIHLLDEPIQSTLHQVMQLNVQSGTRCPHKLCHGTLDKRGQCSQDCTQLGINVVDDIMHCRNCDHYGFPCSSCSTYIFDKQLKLAHEDY